MHRKRMSKKKSRRNFTKGARNIKSANTRGKPMRGGIRL